MKIIFAVVLLFVSGLILSCTSNKAPVSSGPNQGTVVSAPSVPPVKKLAWENEWDRIVQAAQKEGKVVVMSSAAVGEPITKAFKDRFGITLEMIVAPGGTAVQKLITEHRSGLFLNDVFVGGNTTILVSMKPAGILEPLEPILILPELTDPELIKKVWWRGELRWLDKDRYNLGFIAAAPPPVLINTDMVKYDEVKSYKNLLEPRWKGKIVLHDPSRPGFGGKLIPVLGDGIMGWDYVRQLSQQVILSADTRQIVEWVAKGKYPIALAAQTEVVVEFQKAGAPLKAFIPEEGIHVTSSTGSIAYFKNAPHPNAGKLFINWLLTKEGQTIYTQAFGQPSARQDVTTEGIIPGTVPQPGINYFIGDSEEFILKQPQQFEKSKEIFAPLLK